MDSVDSIVIEFYFNWFKIYLFRRCKLMSNGFHAPAAVEFLLSRLAVILLLCLLVPRFYSLVGPILYSLFDVNNRRKIIARFWGVDICAPSILIGLGHFHPDGVAYL